ncbi:MAG: hypothetical protein C4346_04755, partial [Chloroflexota bacterium]
MMLSDRSCCDQSVAYDSLWQAHDRKSGLSRRAFLTGAAGLALHLAARSPALAVSGQEVSTRVEQMLAEMT